MKILLKSFVSLSQTRVAASNIRLSASKFGLDLGSRQSTAFTILSSLAIAISYADRSNLSTAIIPMSDQFHWDSLYSGIVLSSFWAGYALTQIIGGQLADKYGGEKVLLTGLLLWSLFTALTPIAAYNNEAFLIITRVLLGAGEGLALPSIHSMINKYVDPKNRSTSAAIVTAACYLGTLASNWISPKIIECTSWESCFYLFSILPVVFWSPLWIKFTQNNDEMNKKLTDSEVIYESYKYSSEVDPKNWITYLKNPSVWAIISAQYGQSWGMIGLLSWLPTYFSKRFNVTFSDLGDFITLPYLLQLLVAIFAGTIADYYIGKGTPTLKVRSSLQVLGMLVPAACLATCAYIPNISLTTASSLITLGSAASSLTVGGVSCNQFDISKKSPGTIFGIGNTASCIGGLLAVPISGYLFDVTHSWDAMFFMFSLHYIGGALLWLLWASDRPIDAEDIEQPDSVDKKNDYNEYFIP